MENVEFTKKVIQFLKENHSTSSLFRGVCILYLYNVQRLAYSTELNLLCLKEPITEMYQIAWFI